TNATNAAGVTHSGHTARAAATTSSISAAAAKEEQYEPECGDDRAAHVAACHRAAEASARCVLGHAAAFHRSVDVLRTARGEAELGRIGADDALEIDRIARDECELRCRDGLRRSVPVGRSAPDTAQRVVAIELALPRMSNGVSRLEVVVGALHGAVLELV